MQADFLLLIKATFRIYKKALVDSIFSFKNYWKYLLFHLLILLACYAITFVASFFPGMAGGFIVGIFLSFAVSCYLASVSSAFNNDRKDFKTLVQDGGAIFSPVINVFFCFFILNLFLRGMSQLEGLMLFINLAIAVLLNPITEIIQLRPASFLEMFRDSFEFVRENIIEWFLPQVVLMLILFLFDPFIAKSLLLAISTDNPLRLLEYLVLNLSFFILHPISIVILAVTFLLLIFRLHLFKSLSYSTRRKRIYTERNQ